MGQMLRYACWPLLASIALGQTLCPNAPLKEFKWVIAKKLSPYKYITINGQWPAPAITVPQCSEVSLEVDNQSGEDVTLHFHGILQSQFQTLDDGVQGVSQGAISKTRKFKYTFLADKEGTYWIHSHSPGQYPKGLRAPLIVTRDADATAGEMNYASEQTLTVSDWWMDFEYAESRGLSKTGSWSDSTTGTCGDPDNDNGYGIEYPAQDVLFNDVGGYNSSLGNADKTVNIGCTERKRLRFVNLSSHARFYVFFADKRKFEVVELDGISYAGKETDIFEISSGQRVSIIVTAKNLSGSCSSTYIVTASDPKVAHGTNRCRMQETRPDRGVQFNHGYLNVNGQNPATPQDILPAGNTEVDKWLRVWASATLPPPNARGFRIFQTYPKGSWDAQSVEILQNRMQLPYRQLYYNKDQNIDFGAPLGSRAQQAVLGLENVEELLMAPRTKEPAWTDLGANKQDFMHYITLGIVDTSNAEKGPDGKGKGGFASMVEDASKNRLVPWVSPDKQTANRVPSQLPSLPSLFRTLQAGISDDILNTATRYDGDSVNKGRTIVIKGGSNPHWFIIRSNIGDHPMHLHGHHFQILAKLPGTWYDVSATQLYNEVINPHEANRAFPLFRDNPPRRDTIMIEKGITYVLAIKPDNPGVWAFHCHNDIHAISGMFSQIVERPTDIRSAVGSWSTETPATGKDLALVWTKGTGNGVYGGADAVAKKVERNFRGALETYGWTDATLDTGTVSWRVAVPGKAKAKRVNPKMVGRKFGI